MKPMAGLAVTALAVATGCAGAHLPAGVVGARPAVARPTGGQRSQSVPRIDRHRLRWWVPTDVEPDGVAADHGGVVTSGFHWVHAMDPRDGSTRWLARVPDLTDARLAVNPGFVAVAVRDAVVVLERATGRTHLTVPLPAPGPVALTAETGPDGRVLAVSLEGTLVAHDLETGAPRWAVRFPGEIVVPPLVAGNTVVASWNESSYAQPEEAVVRALDLATGALRWQRHVGIESGAPAVNGSTVFLPDGDGNYHAWLHAVDLLTGSERWSARLPASFESVMEPAADERDVAVVDHFGTVTLLDARTGTTRWQHKTDLGVLDTRVVLSRSAVAFRAWPGRLVVLDRSSGARRRAPVQIGRATDITWYEGTLYVIVRLGLPNRLEARTLA